MSDCYQVLGVKRSDSLDSIRKRYRELAKKYHPDLNGGNPDFGKRLQAINEAFAMIKAHKSEEAGMRGYENPGFSAGGSESRVRDPVDGFSSRQEGAAGGDHEKPSGSSLDNLLFALPLFILPVYPLMMIMRPVDYLLFFSSTILVRNYRIAAGLRFIPVSKRLGIFYLFVVSVLLGFVTELLCTRGLHLAQHTALEVSVFFEVVFFLLSLRKILKKAG